jgi:uncharacterized protein (DUF433 family)
MQERSMFATTVGGEGAQVAATRRKIVSQNPEIMSGELVFAGTRVAVKTLVDYFKSGHTLDDLLDGFPTFSRDQAEAYLETTLEIADATLASTSNGR